MRVSSSTLPSLIGTLKSTRTKTRLPARSRSLMVSLFKVLRCPHDLGSCRQGFRYTSRQLSPTQEGVEEIPPVSAAWRISFNLLCLSGVGRGFDWRRAEQDQGSSKFGFRAPPIETAQNRDK